MNTKELIKDVIEEMVAADLSFSLHDVVKYARNYVNNQTVSLTDRKQTYVPAFGGHTYDFEYDSDMKRIVIEALCEMPFDLSISFSTGFRVYTAKEEDGMFAEPPKSPPGGNVIHHKMSYSVGDFLKKKIWTGGSVTVKQVQSALKRGKNYKSISGDEIKATAKSLGYCVDEASPNNVAKITR